MRHSPHNPYVSASVVQDLLIHDIDLALRLQQRGRPPRRSGHELDAAEQQPQ